MCHSVRRSCQMTCDSNNQQCLLDCPGTTASADCAVRFVLRQDSVRLAFRRTLLNARVIATVYSRLHLPLHAGHSKPKLQPTGLDARVVRPAKVCHLLVVFV